MKILVFSSSSIIDINRTYIRKLNSFNNIQIHLAILFKKETVESHNGISNIDNEIFPVTIHEMKGLHPRLESISNLKKLIHNTNPDYILLEYDTASYITYQTLKITKKTKIKVGTIIVENRYRNYLKEFLKYLSKGDLKKSFGSFLCFLFQNYSVKNIDNLFPISKEACNISEKYGFNKNKIYQIPYGIDLTKFKKKELKLRNSIRQRLGLDCFTIAYFGRLVPEKGVDILLKAASKIKDRNFKILIDNFSFYKNNYVNILNQIIKDYKLEENIIFFDANHDQMPDYYNAVDLVVLPSIETKYFKEQYGRVLVEAMSCQTFVIGSNTGAISEILGNSNLLFESNNIESLTQKIIEIIDLNENTKGEIIKASYDRAISSLGVDHQANIINQAIRK